MKMDSIECSDTGDETLGIRELGTAARLAGKYEKLDSLFQGNIDESQDWQSLLEAIERDIITANNHPGFRELQNEDQRPSDIYSKCADMKGPWTVIAKKIK